MKSVFQCGLVLALVLWCCLAAVGSSAQDESQDNKDERQDGTGPIIVKGVNCRALSAIYLDRVINGEEVHQLTLAERTAREHLTEVELKAAHPSGTEDSDTPESAKKRLALAQSKLSTFLRVTKVNVSYKLYDHCVSEAESKGFADISATLYVILQTARGAVDSIQMSIFEDTFEAFNTLVTNNVHKALGHLYEVEEHARKQKRDITTKENVLSLGTAISYGSLLVLSLVFLYLVVSFAFPALLFYYVGYQYVWLVWVRCFFEDTFFRLARQSNPMATPQQVVYHFLIEEQAGMTGLVFLALFGLLVSVGSFLVLPWFLAIFKVSTKSGKEEADVV